MTGGAFLLAAVQSLSMRSLSFFSVKRYANYRIEKSSKNFTVKTHLVYEQYAGDVLDRAILKKERIHILE